MEKKGHMGDFYRNLFRQNVAFGAKWVLQPVPACDGARLPAWGPRCQQAGWQGALGSLQGQAAGVYALRHARARDAFCRCPPLR